ncbi:NAD(P)-binding domain-containing protein [Pseudonocardia ailaonensis]|uniref:NAD(P)-binding domain-containing protein n=2 Tax=Pseudonocardia ailaonensis TaxID=367279 RepID=A0ABN2NFI4_9PSEU
MLAAGFEVVVYEAGSNVGGLWVYENDNGRAQAYRHLCIISTRKHTHFSDFDFDASTPRFPTHWDMHRYLQRYADHFGVTPHVRFRSPVAAVEPAGDGRWTVRTEGGEEVFDAVLVATGHLNEPRHAPELAEFGGEYLHSSAYRVADPFVGRRVAVVGTGNSGVDVASDVCSVAERTVLVARSGVVIQPKVVFGVPFPDIAIGLRARPWIPAWIRNRILRTLVSLAHGNQRRLGFLPPTARTHPTSSEAIVAHIEFNRVAVKPGITAVDGKTLTFADGSQEDFDVLVGATGYRVHLPFLSPEVLPVEGNHVDLYKRIFVPGRPGLYFIGMLNPLTSLNAIFERQAHLVARCVAGEVTLPDEGAMRADIARKKALSAAIFTDSPRHELEEPDTGYVEELRDLVKRGSRSAPGSLATRLRRDRAERSDLGAGV